MITIPTTSAKYRNNKKYLLILNFFRIRPYPRISEYPSIKISARRPINLNLSLFQTSDNLVTEKNTVARIISGAFVGFSKSESTKQITSYALNPKARNADVKSTNSKTSYISLFSKKQAVNDPLATNLKTAFRAISKSVLLAR